MFFLKPREIRTKVLTALVVLLIGGAGVYAVHAQVNRDQTDYVKWYYRVYDVGILPGELKSSSKHEYRVTALSSKQVWGTWEFAHKIHKGWVKGAGEVVPGTDVSVDGHFETVSGNGDYTTEDPAFRTRKASYAGVVAGKYHVYAYTRLNINVTGEGNAVNEKEDDSHTFKLEGDEEPN